MSQNERIANYAAAIARMAQPKQVMIHRADIKFLANSIELLASMTDSWIEDNEDSWVKSDAVADAILNPQPKTIGEDWPL